MKYLLSKDSKGKFRIAVVDLHKNNVGHYCITRQTGCVKGKLTNQPIIEITKTHQNRTWIEQATLQYNNICKKFLDKGYVEVSKHPNEYSEEELNELFGEVKTGQDGIVKPELAKQADKVTNPKTFDKEYYASRKINGVRCLIWYKNGEIHTSSRGATNYDLALYHILSHPILIEFFKNHPNAILDGEVYLKGLTLNFISGICRTQKTIDDGKDLQFYWYDIVELDKPFTERYQLIQDWAKEMNLLPFDSDRKNNGKNLAIQVLPHVKISGWNNMKKLHDEYVKDGWEGLVIRLASSVYKPGARNNNWIKIKNYFDLTCKVIDYELGLRGSEDMCFICELPDGKTFKASPIGDRDIKEEYIKNFGKQYKNQLGDVKYFEISPYGIPQQPKFIAFRWDLK